MNTPHPGMVDTKQGVEDRLLAVELSQPDHSGVSTGVKDESGHSFSVAVEGGQQRMQEVGMGGKKVEHVVEGGGQVGLERWALTRQQVCHITWCHATARKAAGTRLLCPVSPQPTGPVPSAQHLCHHCGCPDC